MIRLALAQKGMVMTLTKRLQTSAHPIVRHDVIDENATPHGDDPSQDEEGAGRNEIESLPRGANAIDDDEAVRRVEPHDAGDMEAVYSRDFRETAIEALTMRHLAIRKPKLNSCETCRRAKALRAKHIRAVQKAERHDAQVASPSTAKVWWSGHYGPHHCQK
jgi:hypothetical protein